MLQANLMGFVASKLFHKQKQKKTNA